MNTHELLIEVFAEEIPHGDLALGRDALSRLVVAGLRDAGIRHGPATAHATPRRLVLSVADVAEAVPVQVSVETGPPVGAPDRAIAGFARGKGVAVEDLVQVESKKGPRWAATVSRGGEPTAARLQALIPEAIRSIPWPKAMRWGTGDFRWVRPIQGLLAVFGGEVIPFALAGIQSGGTSLGHRQSGRDASGRAVPFAAPDLATLSVELLDRHVVLDEAERERRVRAALVAAGIDSPDEELITKVVAVTEWPVVVRGGFEARYLDLPHALRAKILGHHLMFFPVPGEPAFLGFANTPAEDLSHVQRGMEWVVAARLADGAFFWREDEKVRLERRLKELRRVVYLRGRGTLMERALRIEGRARTIAGSVGADANLASRAGLLCKADLVTHVVGEFPELQGWVGGLYAARDGEPEEVAQGIAEHYGPAGRQPIPTTPIGRAVALAEKIDTIVICTEGGKKARGDRDPYGLRRAAIGILRILIEGEHDARVDRLFAGDWSRDQESFFLQRLKGLLGERAPADHVEAVLAAGDWRSPLDVVRRLDALQTADLATLAVPFKRAHNLAKKEAAQPFRADALPTPEGQAVARALQEVQGRVGQAIAAANYSQALSAMLDLAPLVDRFFDVVMVMDPDPDIRAARVGLLQAVTRTFAPLADFTRIQTS